jgi:rSAM/selenodomain-associated transferase 2
MPDVSIIIPTLNEASQLGRTLRHLSILDPAPLEIIIVDGGSQDDTLKLAQGFTVVQSPPGRSIQMNAGAAIATGEILCFLHADTLLPDDAIAVMRQTLGDSAIACGGFISLMTGAVQTRWGVSFHNAVKTYYAPLLFRPWLFFRGLRLLFGDQVMFCRRREFGDCGGFDGAMPIMEEADLCIKLLKYGRIQQVDRVVLSSDRRVAHWGPFKATLIYLYIGCLWGLGVPAQALKRYYEDVR